MPEHTSIRLQLGAIHGYQVLWNEAKELEPASQFPIYRQILSAAAALLIERKVVSSTAPSRQAHKDPYLRESWKTNGRPWTHRLSVELPARQPKPTLLALSAKGRC